MPAAFEGIGLHVIIAVALAVHAMKTGRPFWWLFILFFVPGLGSIAYVVVELIPAMLRSQGAARVKSGLETMVDPDREWRERIRQAELVDSVDSKRALAEECEKRGLWDDAIKLYEAAANGIFADDAALLTGLTRCQLGKGDAVGALATLDRFEHDGAYHSPDVKLLRAKALEAAGRTEDALQEYEAIAGSYPGFEARARYALLLSKAGRKEQARSLFQEVVRSSSARPLALTPADKEWIKIARANLR